MIEFADQPHFSLADFTAAAEGKSGSDLEALQREFWPEGTDGSGITRMRLSKEADGSVALSLRDATGTERLRLSVEADGEAKIIATATDGTERSLHNP